MDRLVYLAVRGGRSGISGPPWYVAAADLLRPREAFVDATVLRGSICLQGTRLNFCPDLLRMGSTGATGAFAALRTGVAPTRCSLRE